ncbi:hypothetical protein Acor_66740 [Acrocarpospora corrugata]|uniref:Uncharacterized protein n=1 Tax=Acrocarpospora corrugata TaxID=35763 RepID=A0A5M3W734_9ACTN|nr:hypothetical protein Acor_66740 [Acrocarpospora corrugata]
MSTPFDVYTRLRHLFPDHGCLSWIRTGDTTFPNLVRCLGGDEATTEAATWDEVGSTAYEDLDEDTAGIMLVARHGE